MTVQAPNTEAFAKGFNGDTQDAAKVLASAVAVEAPQHRHLIGYDRAEDCSICHPKHPSERITEATTHVVAYIPIEEWNAHRDRVEALVNLINGVVNAMARNPALMAVLPPDVIQQMSGKL